MSNMTLINNNGDFYATKLFKVTSQTLATYLLLPTPPSGGNVTLSTYRHVRGKCDAFSTLSFTNS
jgi:hypothetical protein